MSRYTQAGAAQRAAGGKGGDAARLDPCSLLAAALGCRGCIDNKYTRRKGKRWKSVKVPEDAGGPAPERRRGAMPGFSLAPPRSPSGAAGTGGAQGETPTRKAQGRAGDQRPTEEAQGAALGDEGGKAAHPAQPRSKSPNRSTQRPHGTKTRPGAERHNNAPGRSRGREPPGGERSAGTRRTGGDPQAPHRAAGDPRRGAEPANRRDGGKGDRADRKGAAADGEAPERQRGRRSRTKRYPAKDGGATPKPPGGKRAGG